MKAGFSWLLSLFCLISSLRQLSFWLDPWGGFFSWEICSTRQSHLEQEQASGEGSRNERGPVLPLVKVRVPSKWFSRFYWSRIKLNLPNQFPPNLVWRLVWPSWRYVLYWVSFFLSLYLFRPWRLRLFFPSLPPSHVLVIGYIFPLLIHTYHCHIC